jgi:hypothetical protein
MSNFDYIMFLNTLGDRSFNDLTQYPGAMSGSCTMGSCESQFD